MADVGTAYIQIVPSAKGIKGAITKQLDPEADSAGSSAGGHLGSKLTGVAKKVISVAAIGKFLGASITQGGKLEQSIGGVETLFKKSAGKVKGYAAQAYKTTGLSANQYMETVTSFSASLINSLGGNTKKAAKLANTAVVDMSDNANKMGTDMDLIQQTYQSLARGNYAMLDNLKLGYGGTKKEMQRLMKDAEKMTGEHYTLGDFGDEIKAIHAIQEHLGITGTTAREASTTIEGSFNTMKASFQDFLGTIASKRKDQLKSVDASMKALAGSVKVFLVDNLFPMVIRIVKTLPKLIDAANNVMAPLIPQFVKAIVPLVTAIVTALIKAMPLLVNAAIQIAGAIAQALTKVNWGKVGGQVLKAIGKGMQTNAPATIALLAGLGLKGGAKFAGGVKDAVGGAKDIFDGVKKAAGGVKNAIGFLKDLPGIVQGTQELETFKNVFKGIGGVFKNVVTGIGGALKTLGAAMVANPISIVIVAIAGLIVALIILYNKSETFRNFVNSAAAAVKGFVLGAIDAIKGGFNAFVGFLKNVGSWIQSDWTTTWSAIFNFFNTIWNGIKSFASSAVNAVKTVIITVANAIQTAWDAVWNGIKTFFQTIWNGLKTVATVGVNAIRTVVTTVLNAIKGFFSTIWNAIKSVVTGAFNGIKSVVSGGMNAVKNFVSRPLNAIKGLFSRIWNACVNTVKRAVGNLKRLMNFKWHLPKLKLPHIKVTGKLSLDPPSAPHFSIKWYRKAMGTPYLFSNPTLFGAGEAGDEIMYGRAALMRDIANASANDETTYKLDKVIDYLGAILTATDRDVVLDTGQMVSALAPGMDEQLGVIARRRKR